MNHLRTPGVIPCSPTRLCRPTRPLDWLFPRPLVVGTFSRLEQVQKEGDVKRVDQVNEERTDDW